MKRSVIETLLGALVIGVAAFFLIYSYRVADVGAGSGDYVVSADFSGIGGLKEGDDVQISGVKVGSVSGVSLAPDTYLARVEISLNRDMGLPVDTAALISSESLLGGRYLALEPGADEETIPSGGRIQYTQAPQNLEQLLGQFIFAMKDEKDKQDGEANDKSGGKVVDEAPAPETPPVAPEQVPQPTAPEAPAPETPAVAPEAVAPEAGEPAQPPAPGAFILKQPEDNAGFPPQP